MQGSQFVLRLAKFVAAGLFVISARQCVVVRNGFAISVNQPQFGISLQNTFLRCFFKETDGFLLVFLQQSAVCVFPTQIVIGHAIFLFGRAVQPFQRFFFILRHTTSFCITYIKAVLRLGIALFGGGFVPLEGGFCILLHRLAAHIGHGQIFLCGQFATLCPCQQVFPIAAGGILAADLRQCRSVIGILFGQ